MREKKYYIMAIGGIICVALGIYVLIGLASPGVNMKSLLYLCIGGGCGIFGYGMGEILNQKARRRYPDLAREIDIQMKDERNVNHANAAKAKGFDLWTYVFGALFLAYAFMGTELSVLLPFICAYVFVQGCAVYRRIKLDKED